MKKRLRGLLGIYLALALLLASGVALAKDWEYESDSDPTRTPLSDGEKLNHGDTIWCNMSSGGFVVSYDNGASLVSGNEKIKEQDNTEINDIALYTNTESYTVTETGEYSVQIVTGRYLDESSLAVHLIILSSTGGSVPPDPDPGPPSGSGPDLWYIGCNQFGSSMAELPDKLWIDGVPVTGYAGTGGRFELDSLEKSARFITASWGGSTITLAFRPDDCAYSTQIEIPKTGGAPALGCALVSVIAALWACKLRRK